MLSMRPNFTPVKFWREGALSDAGFLSVGVRNIECMFETIDETGLIATIEEAARAEAAAGALRLSAIAELTARRVGEDGERAFWACDTWDSAAAEVAAAMNISHPKASGQMRIAETLRDHLPAVAELYRRGELSTRVVGAITWRTQLIADDAVWALIDIALAERATTWGPLSETRLIAAVDALVLGFDESAVILSREVARRRDFVVGHYEDEDGVVSVWGRLLAADAAVLRKKVAAIAGTVCDADPRNAGERRSDAAAAFANGNDYLVCRCGSPACPVAGKPAPKSSVVINVMADQTAVDSALSILDTTKSSAPSLSSPAYAGTAVLSGTEVIPTPLLAELLRNGAKLRPLCPQSESPSRRTVHRRSWPGLCGLGI
jgi:hypothetical protein